MAFPRLADAQPSRAAGDEASLLLTYSDGLDMRSERSSRQISALGRCCSAVRHVRRQGLDKCHANWYTATRELSTDSTR